MTTSDGDVERIDDRSSRPGAVGEPDDGVSEGGTATATDVPAWLDLPEEPASGVEEATRQLAALLAREAAASGTDVSADIEGIAGSFDSDVLARAVASLHGRIDAAAGSELSPDEAGSARDALHRLMEALWVGDVGHERATWYEVLKEVSHDIRSPLNSILFLVDGLYGERSGPLTDAQRRQLGVVYSAAATLLNIVNDILDFARMSGDGGGEISEVPFPLSNVLADVRRLVGPIAEHRGCRLQTELEVQGPRRGDPQIVSRVLVNLVSNAIDAAGDEGEVVVRVTGDDERLVIHVLDDGDEADPERLRELTAAGSAAGPTTTLTGQTHGLGLVICGRMVRAAGGSLDVRRTSDEWTEFTVELPFRRN